jgi:hypothetical protein
MAQKRLTQILKEFADRVLAKGPAAAAAVVAFLEQVIASAVMKTRETAAGVVIQRDIKLGELARLCTLQAIDGPLTMHAETLLERIGNEVEARGSLWKAEGLHVALTDHLINALKPATPGLADRVAALETVVGDAVDPGRPEPTPPPSRFRSEATSPTGPFGTPPAPPADK